MGTRGADVVTESTQAQCERSVYERHSSPTTNNRTSDRVAGDMWTDPRVLRRPLPSSPRSSAHLLRALPPDPAQRRASFPAAAGSFGLPPAFCSLPLASDYPGRRASADNCGEEDWERRGASPPICSAIRGDSHPSWANLVRTLIGFLHRRSMQISASIAHVGHAQSRAQGARELRPGRAELAAKALDGSDEEVSLSADVDETLIALLTNALLASP
jgi:hypothetical protein